MAETRLAWSSSRAWMECVIPLSATASGDQRFEVRLHDAPDATDVAVALQYLHPEPAFAPGIAERFEHDIEADLVAILEAIGEGLGDVVNPDRPPSGASSTAKMISLMNRSVACQHTTSGHFGDTKKK
jgi:hypothetical protein